MISELQERGIYFQSLTDSVDTSTAMGRFFSHIMSALAGMERELSIERTCAGLAAARVKGRTGGRIPALTPDQIAQLNRLISNGYSRRQLAIIYDVSLSTIYKFTPVNRS
ncbi:recombinase family protein [Salmonella enterica]|nr:recombinase family protein [Salmonella enterica]ELX2841805.1 recombinase family protein [Salmonella enterica]